MYTETVTGRIPIFLVLLPVIATWWLTAATEWRGEVTAQKILVGKSQREFALTFPLSAEPARSAATRMLVSKSSEHDELNAYFDRSIEQRPLYAPYWQDRAKAAFEAGDSEAARRYADKAVALWPNRASLTWKAALLYSRLGDTDRAFSSLRSVVASEPYSPFRAIALALRLEPDPESALSLVLPDGNFDITERDNIVWRLLIIARRQNQFELGTAAWNQFSEEARNNEQFVNNYVGWKATTGKRDEALTAWREYRGTAGSESIENPGFEESVAGGLAWRIYEKDGSQAEQSKVKSFSGKQSMHIEFNGTENSSYFNVRQFVPVDSGASYRLAFYWHGENITTRSGPFVQIVSIPWKQIARTEDKWGSWGWESVKLEFAVPAGIEIIDLRIARYKTDDLDRKISGDLWLDDFKLTKLNDE
ncbi:tetratricopeptide repeat protein [Pseudomonadota bacterium]